MTAAVIRKYFAGPKVFAHRWAVWVPGLLVATAVVTIVACNVISYSLGHLDVTFNDDGGRRASVWLAPISITAAAAPEHVLYAAGMTASALLAYVLAYLVYEAIFVLHNAEAAALGLLAGTGDGGGSNTRPADPYYGGSYPAEEDRSEHGGYPPAHDPNGSVDRPQLTTRRRDDMMITTAASDSPPHHQSVAHQGDTNSREAEALASLSCSNSMSLLQRFWQWTCVLTLCVAASGLLVQGLVPLQSGLLQNSVDTDEAARRGEKIRPAVLSTLSVVHLTGASVFFLFSFIHGLAYTSVVTICRRKFPLPPASVGLKVAAVCLLILGNFVNLTKTRDVIVRISLMGFVQRWEVVMILLFMGSYAVEVFEIRKLHLLLSDADAAALHGPDRGLVDVL
eukprot:GHVU01171062.1.p2 GENE.GHVU01171062.1~~GHVU01171062.1.p2  ORF type:complete len:395 (-),score=97.33 GHVU01171062.1:183-1367(-)